VVNYASVQVPNGIPSGVSAQLVLGTVKYSSGSLNPTLNIAVYSNSMYPVAGIPNVSIVTKNVSILSPGTNALVPLATINFSISGSPVNVREIPIKLSFGTSATTTDLYLYDGTTLIGSTTAHMGVDGTGTIIVQQANGGLPMSESGSYTIKANITGVASLQAGDSVSTQLGAAGNFLWDDIEGNITSGTGALIPSYDISNIAKVTN